MDVEISAIDFEPAGVKNLLQEARRTHVNGGVLFRMFTVSSNATLDWLISHNQVDKATDRLKIFEHDAVFEAFPDLHKSPRKLQDPEWEGVSDLVFSGELAGALRWGGAYHSTSTMEARQLAEDFRICLFEDRFEDMVIFRSRTPWNKWFWNVAWDDTWFILDQHHKRFSLLLMTDTD